MAEPVQRERPIGGIRDENPDALLDVAGLVARHDRGVGAWHDAGPAEAERYARAFRGLAPARWRVFREPTELPEGW